MRQFCRIQGILFLILIAFFSYASGQGISSYCKFKADSLARSGVDTVICYRPYFGPMRDEATDSCMIYERQYLLWRTKQELNVLQYYEYYSINHETKRQISEEHITIDSLDLFGYLKEHFQQVVSDTLLPPKLRIVKEGKELIRDYPTFYVSDDVFTFITVLVGNKPYSNGYNSDYLNDGSFRNSDGTLREQWESLNYQSNLSKAVYQLITRIEKQIAIFGRFY